VGFDGIDPPPEWLLDAAEIAQQYASDPAVTAAADTAQRIAPLLKDIQARVDAMEITRATLDHLPSFNSVASILERQRSAMAEIAFRAVGPVPQAAELEQAKATILSQLPKTEEEIKEVAQAVAEVQADLGKRRVINGLTGGLKRSDVAELTPLALLVLLAWILFHVAGLPVAAHESPAQEAVTSNDLSVIAILVAAYALIRSRD
jgi:hypothetical protein